MMPLAKNALTTLSAMQALLSAPPEDEQIVCMFIDQASQSIETEIERQLRRQSYTERFKGNGRQVIIVREYPIVAIESIEQDGHIIPPELYDFEDTGRYGGIYKDDGWTYYGYPYGLAGDAIAGRRNIKVRYTAGYVLPKDATRCKPCTLPADLEGLCQEMVQSAFGKLKNGGNAGLRSFAISDVRWDWRENVPEGWLRTINKYRRVLI